jgi:hypothetical protein
VPLVLAARHEVGHGDAALGGFEAGFQHCRAGQVTSFKAGDFAGRRKLPVAVLALAEQRGEAGAIVEMRHAQPVDGTVAGDQRAGHRVADETVVLDGLAHACPFLRTMKGAAACRPCQTPRPRGRGCIIAVADAVP